MGDMELLRMDASSSGSGVLCDKLGKLNGVWNRHETRLELSRSGQEESCRCLP